MRDSILSAPPWIMRIISFVIMDDNQVLACGATIELRCHVAWNNGAASQNPTTLPATERHILKATATVVARCRRARVRAHHRASISNKQQRYIATWLRRNTIRNYLCVPKKKNIYIYISYIRARSALDAREKRRREKRKFTRAIRKIQRNNNRIHFSKNVTRINLNLIDFFSAYIPSPCP